MRKFHCEDALWLDTQGELPSLQTLKLFNMCTAVAAALISTFHYGQMRELKLTLDGPHTQEDNNYLFADIADAHPALRALNIGRPEQEYHRESGARNR